ncbi:MAG: ABC transporter permease [Pseudomonadales bacterium]|jgi:ABC-2 type transport system permease protein|nr:ABC transporter permease [Pseudomonadales bacterium]
MQALSRVSAIMFKELRQLARDRLTFGMVVMLPLIQLILFGYAINNNVRNIPVAVVDLAHSSASRAIVDMVRATQVVQILAHYDAPEEAEAAITRGEVRAALILPADLEQRLLTPTLTRPAGQWLIDGSDNIAASALLALRNLPLTLRPGLPQLPPQQLSPQQLQPTPTFEAVLYFNPERRTPVNIVPGLSAIILTMTMILFTSTAIVREKERGNLELLITTPVRSLELMLGKIVPYILIGLVQTAIILGLGHVLFAVPINGSILNILGATLLFITASLTLGLLFSTLAKTQLQAMQLTVFILMPSILLSGFVFPFEGMPRLAQMIAEILPATHFMRMIRGVVLRGASLSDLSLDAGFLCAFTVVGLVVATLKFQKSLD